MALLISGVLAVYRLAEATAKIAGNKGANANVWFISGILLPGVALVLALFLDDQLMKQKECPNCCRRVDQVLGFVVIVGMTLGATNWRPIKASDLTRGRAYCGPAESQGPSHYIGHIIRNNSRDSRSIAARWMLVVNVRNGRRTHHPRHARSALA
jgi:hypothetical protein